MPGGTEYILHDVDENNHIVGKAKFAGHVKVSERMRVDGFGGINIVAEAKEDSDHEDEDDDSDDDSESSESITKSLQPATFNPPSFGVTVLGNSHGFDKSGSVSGYVLWINGRGVMIDPPPYSSATLEREGIRPRMIVAIILTHCHADHDAGAFQKVLTGSQVVVITTPTIYKSFIRKYAALSALSPALLRHSHRHKPAIIGTPLRFQGATFHFTYTLHSIPCIGFRVEWRGRSMVFTGDHYNNPAGIQKLEDQVRVTLPLRFVFPGACTYLFLFLPVECRVCYRRLGPTTYANYHFKKQIYCCTKLERRRFTHLLRCCCSSHNE